MTHPTLLLIESIIEIRAQLQGDPGKLARLQALQQWQVRRLERTYADYSALSRYRDAITFFAHDLYGPHDNRSLSHGQRDHDLKRVLGPWQHVLPQRALHAVKTALELEAITLQLDLAVLDTLPKVDIDEERYAIAYRAANQHDERQRQVKLIVACGHALDALVTNPWIHRALRLSSVPARLAGVLALHELLERGYAAFAKMGGAQELLSAIEQRETAIMKNLFASRDNPFRFMLSRANIAASM